MMLHVALDRDVQEFPTKKKVNYITRAPFSTAAKAREGVDFPGSVIELRVLVWGKLV